MNPQAARFVAPAAKIEFAKCSEAPEGGEGGGGRVDLPI